MRDGGLRGVRSARLRIRRRGGGLAASGPGFYVWDEDALCALDAAEGLARAAAGAGRGLLAPPRRRRAPDA
jgi:hypothetical protein